MYPLVCTISFIPIFGIFGVAAVAGLDARITFIGKHTAFRYGLGAFLRHKGGIPVDRSNPGGIIQDAINKIRDSLNF